jgi:outer membrane protein assembly factor BamB
MAKFLATISAITLFTIGTCGADWPQWRGPNRDGVSAETGLRSQWPASGPKLAWTFDRAGIGYGGPAIVNGTLYLMGSEQDAAKEFVLAIDTATGQQKWKTSTNIAQPMRNFNSDWGGGPRSTPTVDGDHIYVLGVHGDLSCLTKADGKIVWTKSLTKDLGGRCMGIWGYSESPLIDGDVVICSPGYDDKEGQGGVAALDKKTGSIKWQCKELTDQASYGSAVISDGGGVRQYVVMTKAGAAGVRAADGKLLWKTKIGANNIAVIPTPIVSGDLVYLTSDYGSGCGTLQLKKDGDGVKAEPLFDNKVMMNHHGGVILRDGAVFGAHGNANQKKTLPFICQDMKTGKSLWEEKSKLEPSSIVYADGHFYAYGQNTGEVVRFAASTKGFEESGRFTIPKTSEQMKPQGGIWTHPVIADGKLYLRDQELLFCYDLKGASAE